eukprot:m.71146 g.71146  ORF g.71146 m.71146 type:complete len:313 (+) comp50165_c0_seq1:67-1005(+)
MRQIKPKCYGGNQNDFKRGSSGQVNAVWLLALLGLAARAGFGERKVGVLEPIAVHIGSLGSQFHLGLLLLLCHRLGGLLLVDQDAEHTNSKCADVGKECAGVERFLRIDDVDGAVEGGVAEGGLVVVDVVDIEHKAKVTGIEALVRLELVKVGRVLVRLDLLAHGICAEVLDEVAEVLEVAQRSLDVLHGESLLALVVEANQRSDDRSSRELEGGVLGEDDLHVHKLGGTTIRFIVIILVIVVSAILANSNSLILLVFVLLNILNNGLLLCVLGSVGNDVFVAHDDVAWEQAQQQEEEQLGHGLQEEKVCNF